MKKYPVIKNHKNKEVKIRKDRTCFSSSWYVRKGRKMLAVTILPGSDTGHLWGIEKPMTVWFCGECKTCQGPWGEAE